MRLKDKVAVITGAGSGFGRGTALLFAREGARVVVADRDEAAAEATAEAIRQAGGEAWAVRVDVTDPEAVETLVAGTAARYGRIDVLHNNAGVPMPFTPLEEVSLEQWERIFRVNVTGVFLGCRAVIPVMKRQGGGVILNTASTAAVRPRPGLAPYNASKGAVAVLTRTLALELAPYRIRVNAINPVAGDTPMLRGFIGADAGEAYEAGRRRFAESVPLGRLSTPEDVAYAALYLCSDEASLVTGVLLDVDGGRDV